MALSTGNDFVDALGGSPWPASYDTGVNGALLLTVYFDQDETAGHSTGGAWTDNDPNFQDQVSLFFQALHTWEAVAKIDVLRIESTSGVDIWLRKQTTIELPDGEN